MAGSYLEMQAAIGITKHMGGYRATNALLDLCHVERSSDVLEVGCGIGVGPVHLASSRGCRVVGVDRSERMIAWARRRVADARLVDRVDLQVADVLELPFPSDRFDVTICESVLAFVADKERAIAEMIRVTRPGGHVGLNESFLWNDAADPQTVELARSMGTEMVTLEAWRGLWAASGLEEQLVRTYRMDPAREVRDRIRWVGLPWMLRAWGRTIHLAITQPSLRPAFRTVLGAVGSGSKAGAAAPPWAFGYGLFVGTKGGGS